MNSLLRRIRGAIGMGLTWAVSWGLVGFVIELVQEIVPGWNGAIVDIWPMALAVPAFIGGVVFSGTLMIAGRRRRFDEISMPAFAAWGVVGGLLLSGLLVTAAGLSTSSLIAAGVVTLLCGGSAAASLAVARMSEDHDLLAASSEVAEVGLSRDEARDLLGSE